MRRTVLVVTSMPLQGKDRTAGAAGCPKWQHLPFAHIRWVLASQISPEESEDGSVPSQQADLVKHSPDISTDSNLMLPESYEDSRDGASVGPGSSCSFIDILWCLKEQNLGLPLWYTRW